MKKIGIFVWLNIFAIISVWAGNSITYKADTKLKETTEWEAGVNLNAFNCPIVSHTFSDGIGVITFSDKVQVIGDYAFMNCEELKSIIIPKTVIKIGWSAFEGCKGLLFVIVMIIRLVVILMRIAMWIL